MRKLLLLITGLLLLFSVEGQILRYSNYVAPIVQEQSGSGAPSFLSSDGYTVGWYIATETSTMTLTEYEGDVYVDQWRDYLGGGNNLSVVMDWTPIIVNNRVYFNPAVSENMGLKGTFTFNQPEEIWLVCSQEDWNAGHMLFDGGSEDGRLRQNDTSPGVRASAGGSYSTQNDNMPLSTTVIVRILFNGESSELQINETSTVTWNSGTANMGGFTIGNYRGGSAPVEMYVDEIILRSSISDATEKSAIYDYLSAKYLE